MEESTNENAYCCLVTKQTHGTKSSLLIAEQGTRSAAGSNIGRQITFITIV